jgi:CAAX protease family protein
MTRLLALLLFAYVVPPMLIALGIIPFALRFCVLVGVAAGLAVYAALQGYSLRALGFRTDTLKDSLLINISLSAAVIAALLLAYALGLIRAPTIPTWSLFFPFYVLLFCPAQEFTCRSVLFAELARLRVLPAWAQVVITAVTYMFIHIIYADELLLLATLVIGLVWGSIYWLRPNVYGVMLSHAALGVTSILVGLV